MTYTRPSMRMLVLTALTATLVSALVAFSRPIDVIVDGQHLDNDVPPVTTPGNHVYVPVRSLANALGAQTNADGRNVYVVRGTQTLHLRAGDVHASINGMPLTLKHAPFRVRGRLMVGLKAIVRIFGVHATYDARRATVQVMTPGIGEAAPAQAAQTQ